MKRSVLSAMVVVLLLGLSGYASFFIAPTDAKQGLIYRILFLHVASAWTGLTSFFICFIANLLYVLRRQPRWDWLGVSAGETGLVFTTLGLPTGDRKSTRLNSRHSYISYALFCLEKKKTNTEYLCLIVQHTLSVT